MITTCPSCRGVCRPGNLFCTHCGIPLEASEQGAITLPPAKLMAVHEPELIEEIGISSPMVFIGSDPTNEVMVPGGGVSLRHARIVYREGGFWIEDLGSAEGTLLDGIPLRESTALRHGALIKIGSSLLRFLAGPE